MEPAWRDLCSRVPGHGYYQTFDWNWRGWECIDDRKGRTLKVIVGTDEDRTVLIWPLAVSGVAAWRIAGWLGSEAGGYGDVLVEPGPKMGEWQREAWRHIASKSGIDVTILRYVRKDSSVDRLLDGMSKASRQSVAAPFIAWDDHADWPSYVGALKSNLRKDQRRRRRRLEGQGELTYRQVEGVEDIEALIDWMFVHRAAQLERGGMTGRWFESSEHRDFVGAAVADARAAGNLYLAKLAVDETVVAAEMGIVYEGCLYSWWSAFDMEWSKYSPGRIALEESLKWSCENGLGIFDFKPIGESYKYDWTGRDVTVNHYLLPCSSWGRVYCGWSRSSLRAWAEKLYYAIPRGPRRLIGNALLR